jgi:hypothetical protein
MGRPPGAQNKMTRERDAAAKELAEQYGDPLEDILQKRAIYAAEMAKTSRHRNRQKLAEAEEKILRYNVEALPYMRPRYQAIAHSGEVVRPTVIRAPAPISDSKEWLRIYGPKRDNAVNDKPAVLPWVKNVKDSLATAEQLGVDDAQTIWNEAAKITKNEDKA